MTVTDDAGRAVSIPRPPMRIVSIAPSNTEILFALGVGDRVVAVDQYSDFPPEAKSRTQVGSYVKPNLEAIVAAQPDLVVGAALHAKTIVPELTARGLTTLLVEPKDVDQTFERILLVGDVVGQADRADRMVGDLRERAASIAAKVQGAPKPRVFFELSPQLHSAGPGTFVDDLIRRAGGQNVVGDAATQWPQVSLETLVQRDPEIVLLADAVAGETADKVRGRPGWGSMSAVKGNRVAPIDPDLTNRPGPRIVDGLEAVARLLHPDRVK